MQTNAYGKPIRDPELLRRIEKARAEQCLNDSQGALHDPIEDEPHIKPIVRQVERRAEKSRRSWEWVAATMCGAACARF
jgi:hypothetical protein